MGCAVVQSGIDLREQVEFIGEVTVDLAASIFRPRRMRWKEVFRVFETAGVNALPIVSLDHASSVGMVIAFESAQPLAQFGAQVFVANLLGLVMARELGPCRGDHAGGPLRLGVCGGSGHDESERGIERPANARACRRCRFLVVQRVMAGILLTPLLTMYAMFCGVAGRRAGVAGTGISAASGVAANSIRSPL